jgi:hypothetical protein
MNPQMGNANYIRGRAIEYRGKKELEQAGYYVVRSAGSHSAFDLVAWNDQEILFIQCKREKKSAKNPKKKKYKRDLIQIDTIKIPPNGRKEFWIWRDRKGWTKSRQPSSHSDSSDPASQLGILPQS